MNALASLLSALRRRLLGVSPDEIRHTVEDLRAEIRATRAELKQEIDELRRRVDAAAAKHEQPRGPEIPVAEA